MLIEQSYDCERVRDDQFAGRPTKSVVIRESIVFLTKVYRLIYMALVIFALGAYATVGIGLIFMMVALFTYPDDRSSFTLEPLAEN